MTAIIVQLKIPGMAKPGRRKGTPSEFRNAFIERTKAAREKHFKTHEAIADALTRELGREIRADSYRKYESKGKGGSMLPHDLIVPFCDLTGIDTYELMTGAPFNVADYRKQLRRKTA